VDLPNGGLAPEVAITLQDGSGGFDSIAQFVGGELFPSFETSLFGEGLSGGYGGAAASLTAAADISELLGSRWGAAEDERFKVFGDVPERRFRCGQRSAPTDEVAVVWRCVLAARQRGAAMLHGCRWCWVCGAHMAVALAGLCSTELERLRSQGVEAPRDRAAAFFGGQDDPLLSPGAQGLRGHEALECGRTCELCLMLCKAAADTPLVLLQRPWMWR
jgi:hypothetical protein